MASRNIRSAPSTKRVRSVSSMRTMNVPAFWCANAQFTRATYMLPMCGSPVGLGAMRVRTAACVGCVMVGVVP